MEDGKGGEGEEFEKAMNRLFGLLRAPETRKYLDHEIISNACDEIVSLRKENHTLRVDPMTYKKRSTNES